MQLEWLPGCVLDPGKLQHHRFSLQKNSALKCESIQVEVPIVLMQASPCGCDFTFGVEDKILLAFIHVTFQDLCLQLRSVMRNCSDKIGGKEIVSVNASLC